MDKYGLMIIGLIAFVFTGIGYLMYIERSTDNTEATFTKGPLVLQVVKVGNYECVVRTSGHGIWCNKQEFGQMLQIINKEEK